MKTMVLIAGVGLVAFGMAEWIWFVRSNGRRSVAAQATMFLELGFIFVIEAVLPESPLALSLMILLGVSMIFSIVAQVRLLRQEGRTLETRP